MLKTKLKKFKKKYFSKLIIQHQSNIKKNWSITKEIIWEKKVETNQQFTANDIHIYDECKAANTFNIVEVGPILAKNIRKSKKFYKLYLLGSAAQNQPIMNLKQRSYHKK